MAFYLLISLLLVYQPNNPETLHSSVVNYIEQRTRIGDRDTTLYWVHVSVFERNIDSVYIQNYGLVQNKTEVKFLTGAKRIKIFNKNAKTLLRTLKLKNKVKELSPSSILEFAASADFEDFQIERQIKNPRSFDEKVMKVVNNHFEKGIRRYMVEGKTVIETSYTKTSNQKYSPLNQEICMKISYRYLQNGLTLYKISYLVRENRSHDKKWRDVKDNLTKETTIFIKNFVNEIDGL